MNYTTKELGAALGFDSLLYANTLLNRWDKDGVLKPSIRKRSGSGKLKALYSEQDLLIAKVLMKCAPPDTSNDFVKETRRLISNAIRQFPTWTYLIVRSNAVSSAMTAEQVMSSIDKWGPGLVINLEEFRKEME